MKKRTKTFAIKSNFMERSKNTESIETKIKENHMI